LTYVELSHFRFPFLEALAPRDAARRSRFEGSLSPQEFLEPGNLLPQFPDAILDLEALARAELRGFGFQMR
jgi:hypothetical protein